MVYIVYKTVCLINNKMYIGVHGTTNINDGYIGCGIYSQKVAEWRYNNLKIKGGFTKAVIKYQYQNFKREILYLYESEDEAYKKEIEIVNEEWINNKNTYNFKLGGKYGGTVKKYKHLQEEWINLYSFGYSTHQIAKIYNLKNSSVLNYIPINIRRKHADCINKDKKKLIKCITTGEVFKSLTECSQKLFGHTRSLGCISDVANGKKTNYKQYEFTYI